MTFPRRLVDSIEDEAIRGVLRSAQLERPSREAALRTGMLIGVSSTSMATTLAATCAARAGAKVVGPAGTSVVAGTPGAVTVWSITTLGVKSMVVGLLVLSGGWSVSTWLGDAHPATSPPLVRHSVATSAPSVLPVTELPAETVPATPTQATLAVRSESRGPRPSRSPPPPSARGPVSHSRETTSAVPGNGEAPQGGGTSPERVVVAFEPPEPPRRQPGAVSPTSVLPAAQQTTRPRTARLPAATLGDEVALLDSARRALREGRPQVARTVLDRYFEHAEFRTLALEATVLRIQVLLQSGQRAEAALLARQLLQRLPPGRHADQLQHIIHDASH